VDLSSKLAWLRIMLVMSKNEERPIPLLKRAKVDTASKKLGLLSDDAL
jgi:hypothetical protein